MATWCERQHQSAHRQTQILDQEKQAGEGEVVPVELRQVSDTQRHQVYITYRLQEQEEVLDVLHKSAADLDLTLGRETIVQHFETYWLRLQS